MQSCELSLLESPFGLRLTRFRVRSINPTFEVECARRLSAGDLDALASLRDIRYGHPDRRDKLVIWSQNLQLESMGLVERETAGPDDPLPPPRIRHLAHRVHRGQSR